MIRLRTGTSWVLNPVGARELYPEYVDPLQHPLIHRVSGSISLGWKQLRCETSSYHDPNGLWNPSCIITLKYVLCMTKYYGLLSQEFYLSFTERMQDLTKIVRCSNILQIFTFLNMPALNHKTQSKYLIGMLLHFKLLSCPALASEGCHFMWKMCTEN